ncbi:hypothetical protein RRG08_024220 [Elysia crispata]|uniref:Uncharacterized protein n=1 Tax=Elysia crispata TaxID=231223 RepID=A0AAE0YQE9_9GAST|nr:hypothetical protein RRG08_024220 [Elysia crispata]
MDQVYRRLSIIGLPLRQPLRQPLKQPLKQPLRQPLRQPLFLQVQTVLEDQNSYGKEFKHGYDKRKWFILRCESGAAVSEILAECWQDVRVVLLLARF